MTFYPTNLISVAPFVLAAVLSSSVSAHPTPSLSRRYTRTRLDSRTATILAIVFGVWGLIFVLGVCFGIWRYKRRKEQRNASESGAPALKEAPLRRGMWLAEMATRPNADERAAFERRGGQ
ncbi:hypothetical protein H2199_005494 [Coniosporium tulheliwenetii]|uniref:Uncharacterized protein n=1 Tax=Coniosporium tulheliwenetii TaxID=3383036 RepID=A0ACC2Z1H9_9PEZI|nr:hypothetical protein H2199_005494 [Cladosporium sp. JES 115]